MMVQPNDDDCVTTGKEREDRHSVAKNRFESLQLNVKCPDTAILLLGSRERPVLVAAASALTKFAAKGKENLEKLFELDIVDSLIPLIDHEDLFTRRFAARLLGEMMAITFVRNYSLESQYHLPRFVKIANEDSDVFMKEYASLILAEISKDPYGAAKILENCSNIDFLFENLKISDPDVKKNNIEIVDNLLNDLVGADKIIGSRTFSFRSVCELFREPYPEIQNLALSVLKSLVARSHDNRIQRLFRDSGALKIMCDLLNDIEFADLHSGVLRVLIGAVENRVTMETFVEDGGLAKLLTYFETSADVEETRDVLDVLVRFADTTSGRKILYNFGMVKHLLQSLHATSRDQETSRIICYGIGTMSRYEPASKEITEANPTKAIMEILKDESLKWSVREASAFALKELCTSDEKNCQNFLEIKGPTYLQRLLKETPEKVPIEVAITAIDILSSVRAYPELKIYDEAELIDSLLSSFAIKDRAADQLKIVSCRALADFCVEKHFRDICLARNIVNELFQLLSDIESTPVRAAAVQLVQQLAEDCEIVDQFIHAGYLNYMLKNRAISSVVPAWNTCIDFLFSAHLPAKFAAKGFISMHETTDDGFYVMRRHICPFPILDELFRLKMCPVEPIYVVNFHSTSESVDENLSTNNKKEGKYLSMDSTGARLELKFGQLQKDPYLQDYLELFKCILAANESLDRTDETRSGIVDISKIALRAKLLGNFVARQMSGPDPQNPCVDHQLEIHVREIRDDIETSVIPLGQLRVGSYLERALLFKVMADRIALPTTLVRGEYGKAWNEIAVPEIEDPIENSDASRLPKNLNRRFNESKKSLATEQREIVKKSSGSTDMEDNSSNKVRAVDDTLKTILPTRLLKENYIVDLMEKPGNLIPINSAKAKAYCSPVTRCDITCDV